VHFALVCLYQAVSFCVFGGVVCAGPPATQNTSEAVFKICADSKLKPHRALDLKVHGLNLLQDGKCKGALTVFDEYTNCCPYSWRAFACRATARAIVAENKGCLQDLNRYLYIKRNASFHLTDSAQRADVEDKNHPGPIAPPELSISIADCNRLREVAARKNGKGSAANQLAQAVISFFEHDYRRALTELALVRGSESKSAPVLAMRSICHRAIGDFAESAKEANEAISKSPDERVYYDTLDGAYFAWDKREDGLKELTKMLSAHPRNTALLLTVADVNSQLGNREQARTLLSKLLSIHPATAEALIMRADTYKADLINDKAFADYKAANLLTPRDGRTLEGMGFSCYELNRIDQASSYFDTLIRAGYDLKRVCAAQSLCLEKQGKPAIAERLRSATRDFLY
jgi:tetratricopeptide (TPR) repeat protein